jgi:hypothetical protein
VEESAKVKMFDKFIHDLKELLKNDCWSDEAHISCLCLVVFFKYVSFIFPLAEFFSL